MKRKLLVLITCITLMTPSVLPISERMLAQDNPAQSAPQPAVAQEQAAPTPQYQSTKDRRSYERETRTRHHHRITKEEVIFLAAVAATPMGIGALAGGARGLAIGSIVGGWGAFGAHHLWKHLHR
jgi:hypothetical protein